MGSTPIIVIEEGTIYVADMARINPKALRGSLGKSNKNKPLGVLPNLQFEIYLFSSVLQISIQSSSLFPPLCCIIFNSFLYIYTIREIYIEE